MSRMTPERLAEIEGESVEFELVDALKAERKCVEELEAEVTAWMKREDIAWDQANRLQSSIEAALKLADGAKPVYATAKNTASVRTGHELGGYIKHYELPTHIVIKLREALGGSDEL